MKALTMSAADIAARRPNDELPSEKRAAVEQMIAAARALCLAGYTRALWVETLPNGTQVFDYKPTDCRLHVDANGQIAVYGPLALGDMHKPARAPCTNAAAELDALREAVSAMRQAQKAYFARRGRADLQAALTAEKRVDKLLAQIPAADLNNTDDDIADGPNGYDTLHYSEEHEPNPYDGTYSEVLRRR